MKLEQKDTSMEIEGIQIELLRRAGFSKRFLMTRNLSQSIISLSRKAIQEHNKEKDDLAIKVEYVSLFYGSELADRFQRYLIGR